MALPREDRQSSAPYDALLLDHIKNARNYRLPETPARVVNGILLIALSIPRGRVNDAYAGWNRYIV